MAPQMTTPAIREEGYSGNLERRAAGPDAYGAGSDSDTTRTKANSVPILVISPTMSSEEKRQIVP
jgi:hypothetical protein